MIGCAMIECLIIECLIIGCLIIGHLMILYWTDDELHTNIFEGESHGRISMIGEFIFLTKIEGDVHNVTTIYVGVGKDCLFA